MFENEIERKRQKSKVYATQPERFELKEMKVTMSSQHDTREISYKDNKWQCSCEFYLKANTCSHIMALQEIIKIKY